MIRPYELFIGLRYTRARRRSHFISFISLISICGITLGISALIIVLSVMNGFGKEWRSRILGAISHVEIKAIDVTGRRIPMVDWPTVSAKADANPAVAGSAPFIEGIGLLTKGKISAGVQVRGIDPKVDPRATDFYKKMRSGRLTDLKPGKYGMIVGRWWEERYGLGVGKKVLLVIPQGSITPAGFLPRLRTFNIVGVFDFDMYQTDSGVVLIHMADAAKLYRLQNRVSGLRLKLHNIDQAPEISNELQQRLGNRYDVQPWTRQYGGLFQALQTEKITMFIILLLIVTVAMFNVISTLVVVVKEKESDIAILRTLGTSPASVMGIFMVQGTIVGIIGTALGTLLGVIVALNVPDIVQWLEQLFNTKFIAATVYGISRLPSDLQWFDVTVIAAVSLLLGLLSTLYPAWRAANIQPAEALRYE